MVIYQVKNARTGAYIKIKVVKGQGARILEVKKKDPSKPFKDIPIKKKK